MNTHQEIAGKAEIGRIGIAADHGGLELKQHLVSSLRTAGYEVMDACIAANKVPGVRAALISDSFSTHQGVEDDDMNVMCLGGRVIGQALSWDLTKSFLDARFKRSERFKRRLKKVETLENEKYHQWIL